MPANMNEFTSPIRLLFGIGNNVIQGFTVVYEDYYGVDKLTPTAPRILTRPVAKVRRLNVWYDDPEFKLVRFINEGESCIVWAFEFIPAKQSFFVTTPAHIEREVKEIRLRRDVQLTMPKS